MDTGALAEVAGEHVNLNAQIATEPEPADPRVSLDRIFGNDLVAIDANAAGTDFLIVSRGGNYVLYHAPYLHHGRAQTLADVFPLHILPALEDVTIAEALSAEQQQDLLLFLNSIDGRTVPFRSEAGDFRDALALP